MWNTGSLISPRNWWSWYSSLPKRAFSRTMTDFRIDAMRPEDWPAVRAIYLEGIHTGNATFETEAPSWEKWDASHHRHSRVIARDKDRILGWAALRPVSDRKVYEGVAEVSVY